ncbi:MAG: NAD(P)/FAD-dependent oxidoreductase [Clostridia bacterium]|nr:NAD(P)/FAD-dependent oxidoreductase [Clostridia bacterium]
MKKTFDVAIVGGGAAGVFAAINSAKLGNKVALIEKNEKLLQKLKITGKGRCNLTSSVNSIDEIIENIATNKYFMYSALSSFSNKDTVHFFENLGVELKEERGNRIFPTSDSALTVVNALISEVKRLKITIIHDKAEKLIVKDGKINALKCRGELIETEKVIIATGGLSYPKTGSTGDGYKIAKDVGHKITKLKPSLIGLKSKDTDIKKLSGLTIKNVSINLFEKEKSVYKDFGEVLFTHVGISGPIILSASSHLSGDFSNVSLHLDLKPALDFEKLDNRLIRDFTKFERKDFINALDLLFPKEFAKLLVNRTKIAKDTKVNQITKSQRRSIINLIKDFEIKIVDFESIENAIITSGGVDCREIDPKTMQSKLVNGLYFAGEILDVDGYTGGFNLQIAFSTAYVASQLG